MGSLGVGADVRELSRNPRRADHVANARGLAVREWGNEKAFLWQLRPVLNLGVKVGRVYYRAAACKMPISALCP